MNLQPAAAVRSVPTVEQLPVPITALPAAALDVAGLRLVVGQEKISVTGWRVDWGDRVALVGRNGAGKTSIIEAILGLRNNAEISGCILGRDFKQWRRDATLRRQLGVQLQQASLPVWLRVSEMVAVHRSIFSQTCPHVIEALGVGALLEKRYEWLSRGERQRVDLFMALAHRPALAVLDEPFSGLDPSFTKACSELLLDMSNLTLLMCCHTVEELRVATRVAWIDNGLRRYADVDALKDELLGQFRLRALCQSLGIAEALAQHLRDTSDAVLVATVGEAVEAFGGESLQRQARGLIESGEQTIEFGRTGLLDLLQHCARSTTC